jgi:hypothetical protein
MLSRVSRSRSAHCRSTTMLDVSSPGYPTRSTRKCSMGCGGQDGEGNFVPKLGPALREFGCSPMRRSHRVT